MSFACNVVILLEERHSLLSGSTHAVKATAVLSVKVGYNCMTSLQHRLAMCMFLQNELYV